MSELNHWRAKAAFASLGYSERDYVNADTIKDILGNLGNEEFDQDIFEQLWEQCKLNSQGKSRLDTFTDNLIRAEAILMQKQNSVTHRLQYTQDLSPEEESELRYEIEELNELKGSFLVDLEIIRKPFRHFTADTIQNPDDYSKYPVSSRLVASRHQTQSAAFIPFSNKKNLTWVMYLALLLSFLAIFVSLNVTAFTNILLSLLILSLCLFEHFDRQSLRLLFWATVFTLVVDIVWYCIQVSSLWSLASTSMWPQSMSGYLKFTVVLVSVIFVVKIFIAMLLCSEYNIDQVRPQQINICTHKFVLSSKTEYAPLKSALLGYISQNALQENLAASHANHQPLNQ